MSSRRDEHGSILPMTALLVVVLLGFTAFAVDLGLNRVAARDMQSLADAAALDAARGLPSCDTSTLTARANRTKARHGRVIGDSPPLLAEPGNLDATGTFQPTSGGASCSAVRVTASTSVDFAFAPVIGTDSGSATRRAVASQSEAAVCFSAGTKALALNSSQSALGPLLDRIIRVNGLDVAGYEGIVRLKDLSVPVADLAAQLGAGTPAEVAGLTVTLREFLAATATVLANDGSADAVARATLLESIALRADDLTLAVGDILNLGTGGSSGLQAEVNAIDLVAASIVAANGENAIRVDGLAVTLPLDLVNSNTRLVVVEPPQIACGPVGTKARTAQVRLDLQTGVDAIGLTSAMINLGVEVARGEAELTAIRCSSPRQTTVRGTTGLARIVGRGGTGNAGLSVKLLGIELAGVRLSGDVGPNMTTHNFPYPPAPDLKQHYGGTARIILSADVSGLGGILNPLNVLLNPILNTVNALTGTLDNLLRPLLSLLGIQVGSMDVMMLGTPTCNGVRLAG